MPLGINRSDPNNGGTSYRNGTPITLPHTFGNPVTTPKSFGNPIPSDGKEKNTITLPHDFGNKINPSPAVSYLLQGDGVSHLLLAGTSGALLVS